jgi:hypothetical protein
MLPITVEQFSRQIDNFTDAVAVTANCSRDNVTIDSFAPGSVLVKFTVRTASAAAQAAAKETIQSKVAAGTSPLATTFGVTQLVVVIVTPSPATPQPTLPFVPLPTARKSTSSDSTGVIVGAAVGGGVGGLILIVGIVICIVKRKAICGSGSTSREEASGLSPLQTLSHKLSLETDLNNVSQIADQGMKTKLAHCKCQFKNIKCKSCQDYARFANLCREKRVDIVCHQLMELVDEGKRTSPLDEDAQNSLRARIANVELRCSCAYREPSAALAKCRHEPLAESARNQVASVYSPVVQGIIEISSSDASPHQASPPSANQPGHR